MSRIIFTAIIATVVNHCFAIASLQVDSLYNHRLTHLQREINMVLNDYPGLCAGLGIVRKGRPDWIVGLGANRTDNEICMSENTIYRTASISKMFVALAILKLQEDGKLMLDDNINEIIPEIQYENPWEDTNPIKIVHLLEHTTGWDEIHFVERTHNQFPPISLIEALSFHPHSRKSRWIPGTRMAYCNSGYAVAAYIVEKISGLTYEKYIDTTILKPLKMDHTTFFDDSVYRKWSADTYNWAMQKSEYKHELYRPSGALNSSPKDMTQILKLLTNQDASNLISKESVKRMEKSKSTPGSSAGLELGYGLGIFTTEYNGFIYHGHDGAMDGGLSHLAYIPEHGLGHVLLLNANNADAMQRILTLIREFETEDIFVKAHEKTIYNGPLEIQSGYHLAIDPRNQNLFYQDALFAGIEKIEVSQHAVYRSWIIPGRQTIYHPVSSTQLTLGNTDKIGMVVGEDPLAGKVLYVENSVLKPISHFRVFSQLALVGLWLTMMVIGVFVFSIVAVLYIFNRQKYKTQLSLVLLPTITTFLIILTFFLRYSGFNNVDLLFSSPTILSVGLLLSSVLFVLATMYSMYTIYKFRRHTITWIFRYPAIVLTCLHLLASVYFLAHGFIPVVTWI